MNGIIKLHTTPAHFRESIRHAVNERAWAISANADQAWLARACDYSRAWARRAANQSIKQLASHHLRYWRMRASFTYGCDNQPIDPIAYDRWIEAAKY